MARKKTVDVEKIKEAILQLKPDGELYEIRILKGRTIISGYFKGVDGLDAAFKTVDLNGANVFYTLNTIDDSCYSREQRECFRQCKSTTSDADIVGYSWLLVDLDPVRRTGISSTRDELIAAYDRGNGIVEYLRELWGIAPIMACSGNGIHLLYPIQLKNTDKNKELIERCLKALALLFSDERVEVDTSVFNPARISKLYGTLAQKGASTKERPHRMSRIISVPPNKQIVEMALLERLASELPEEPQRQKSTKQSGFDVEEWLNDYGIRVHAVKQWKDATRYVLEECPFDNSHKAPDATIIKMKSGAVCFKCLHNSCSGHDWRELRIKYEPDAYDDKRAADEARIEAGWKQYKAYNRNRTDIQYEEKPFDAEAPSKMFETVSDILAKPKEQRVCIKTGLEEFDKRVGGLAKGEITLVSGLRGSGKSSLLSQWILNAVDQDFNVVAYSGELKDERFVSWLLQQAAGKYYVEQSKKYENYYFCKDEVKPKIAEWIGERFHLYNNNHGSNFKQIAVCLHKIIQDLKSDLVIIDNMSILDLSDITEDRRSDKWDQQKLFVETLKNIAMLCRCHIVFVVHPRKTSGFLRLNDVGGSGAIGNLVDNAFIVHRANKDFFRGYRRDICGVPDTANKKKSDEEYCGEDGIMGDNVIEIAKERETGIQDVFLPLWYERETKRLKGSPDEYTVYGWDIDGFMGRNIDEVPPFE